MNQQLKKGDRCQSPYGLVTIIKLTGLDIFRCKLDTGGEEEVCTGFLKRLPTHAERMHKVIDIAFDAEDRLEDGETVQITVGDLSAFVRHYCHLRNNVDANISSREYEISRMAENNAFAKKLLKGES
jgi:hypothetical protein